MQMAKSGNGNSGYRSRDGKKTPNLATLSNRFSRALERESRHILNQSSQGKLDKNSAADLVNYMKLLKSLIEEEKSSVGNLSEEEIEKALETKKTKP